jgi:hypothetical protein
MSGYWINPYGKIFDLQSQKHITNIIKNPTRFHITRDEIFAIHKKYGERVGTEGRAREEIIKQVIDLGFIRIRYYANQFWAVSAKRFDNRTKKALTKWAEVAKDDKFAGPNMKVVIDLPNGFIIKGEYTVKDLYYEKHINESNWYIDPWFNPEFVDTLDAFSRLKPIYLMKL